MFNATSSFDQLRSTNVLSGKTRFKEFYSKDNLPNVPKDGGYKKNLDGYTEAETHSDV